MKQNANLNNNESIHSIESFNFLLADMNKSSVMNQLDQKINESDIKLDKDFFAIESESKKVSTCLEITLHFILTVYLFLFYFRDCNKSTNFFFLFPLLTLQ